MYYQYLQFKEFNAARKADAKIELQGYDFKLVDLKGADLSNCYFRQTDLSGLDLSECNLAGASIHDENIGGVLFPKNISSSEIRLSKSNGIRMRLR